MKILYVVNSSAFFCSHFLELAKEIQKSGFEVTILAGDCIKKDYLISLGFKFTSFNLSRKGVNPFFELISVFSLFREMNKIKPDILHLFTIKPIVYCGLLTKLFRFNKNVRSVYSVTGLGSASLDSSLKGRFIWSLIQKAYRFVFSNSSVKVVFENSDDRKLFIHNSLTTKQQSYVVNGAGVDIKKFCPIATEMRSELRVVLVARLLKDKGVREYIEAGKLLNSLNKKITLQLVGGFDPGNPSAMTESEILKAHENGFIEYLGQRDDIHIVYQNADIACLPSYREGLPKSLIEAAACGLTILTTDVPGCRQMIFNGENGCLVKPYSGKSIADALIKLSDNPNELDRMGSVSREKAISLFSHSSIISSFKELYNVKSELR
ncbi:glycosyltransferase family 4 protein [Shewanella sp. ULN5]|uniref:glycosyltransferase family 4 protein n=1 Tax=Shewanella sp. ULN5 TaxID=2994678 RepID=UPI00273D0FB7|nr:glycosyltransferase family 4 protein [Shewanella sp. ULN5]MDP5145068.1 glycosyltransferase family 4 protein [Shewanella sp. ULN5]